MIEVYAASRSSISSKFHILLHAVNKSVSDSKTMLSDYTIYLRQLFPAEFDILYCLDIVKHLLRSGGPNKHTRHNPVAQYPAQCHLGKCLPPSCRNPVKVADLLRRSSVSDSFLRNLPSVIMRLSSGIPFKYRFVSSPWASGLNAMMPFPNRAAVSFSPLFSIVRSKME